MRPISTLLFTLMLSFSALAQSTDLSLRLEKGNAYQQVTSSRATIIQEFNGQKMNVVMTMSGTVTFLVREITEGAYHMETTFRKLGMAVQGPQGTIDFSSEKNDPNDIFSTILAAMKGKAFEVTMSKAGKVIEVKNVEALWEPVVNHFEHLPEMQKEQIKAQIMKAYGADALKGNIEMVTAIYPDQPVAQGDRWTINTSLESGMSGTMTTEYEFAGMTPDYALIKGNSTIVTADKDAYIETNGMPMKYDLSGTMTSEIRVDKNTGWIIEASIHQQIKGDAYIGENPQAPNGMKVFMTMINEMVISN